MKRKIISAEYLATVFRTLDPLTFATVMACFAQDTDEKAIAAFDFWISEGTKEKGGAALAEAMSELKQGFLKMSELERRAVRRDTIETAAKHLAARLGNE